MAKRTKRRGKTKRADGPAAMRHLYDRYVANDPRQRAVYEDHMANAEIALQINYSTAHSLPRAVDITALVRKTAEQ